MSKQQSITIRKSTNPQTHRLDFLDGLHLSIDVTIQELLSKLLAANSFMLRVTDAPDLRTHMLAGASPTCASQSMTSESSDSLAYGFTGVRWRRERVGWPGHRHVPVAPNGVNSSNPQTYWHMLRVGIAGKSPLI